MKTPKRPDVEKCKRRLRQSIVVLSVALLAIDTAAMADPFNPGATVNSDAGNRLFKGHAAVTSTEISRAPAATVPTKPEAAEPEVVRFDITLVVPTAMPPGPQAVVRPERVSALRLPGGITLGMAVSAGTRDCFTPDKADLRYCLEAVPWPEDILDSFVVSTSLYRGAKALVRYRKGTADSVYVLFQAAQYDRVHKFLTGRFGTPRAMAARKVSFIGRPAAENPSAQWRTNEKNQTVVLDIRGIDDLRSMLPDPTTGALRIQHPGGIAMFADLDPDLMMMNALRQGTAQR